MIEEVSGFIHFINRTEKVDSKKNPKNIFRIIPGNCLIIRFRLNRFLFGIKYFSV
jgi:hypothetical protein